MGPLLAVAFVLTAPSLAFPGLNGVNVSAEELALHEGVLATELTRAGLKVLSARDVAALVGLERQKQLLGCAESDCLAEITGALGVAAILVGDVGLVAGRATITLRVVSSKDASVLATFVETNVNASDVGGALQRGAVELARQLLPAGASGPSRWWALVPAAIAVGAGTAAVLLQVEAGRRYDELTSLSKKLGVEPTETLSARALSARDAGSSAQTWSAVLIGVAATGVLASFFTFVFTGAPLEASAVLSPGGSLVTLAGRFP